MMLKIGGWGCGAGFSPTPEPGNRFRLRLRLRCVRACERAKLRARDDSPVAGARRANLWVVVVVVRRNPSSVVRAAISMKSSRSETFDR